MLHLDCNSAPCETCGLAGCIWFQRVVAGLQGPSRTKGAEASAITGIQGEPQPYYCRHLSMYFVTGTCHRVERAVSTAGLGCHRCVLVKTDVVLHGHTGCIRMNDCSSTSISLCRISPGRTFTASVLITRRSLADSSGPIYCTTM